MVKLSNLYPSTLWFVSNLIFIHINSVSKWKLLMNDCYKTVSGHFFAICTFIFHKAEDQMVILRCLMGLNFNWFQSYGLICSLRPRTSSVNSQKKATDKWPFYNIWPFLPTTWLSFTKLRFRRSIWGAHWV